MIPNPAQPTRSISRWQRVTLEVLICWSDLMPREFYCFWWGWIWDAVGRLLRLAQGLDCSSLLLVSVGTSDMAKSYLDHISDCLSLEVVAEGMRHEAEFQLHHWWKAKDRRGVDRFCRPMPHCTAGVMEKNLIFIPAGPTLWIEDSWEEILIQPENGAKAPLSTG